VVRGWLRALRGEELARGVALNVVLIGVQSAITLVAAVLAARFLGPTGVGIVAIGLLIAEFASTLDNLPSQGFVRDMATAPAPEKVATVLATKGALGLVTTLILLALSPLLATWFRVPLSIPLTFAFIPTASIVSSVALMTWEAQRDMARRNATQLAEAIARIALYAFVAFAVSLPYSREASIAFATLAASAFASLVGALTIPSLSVRGFSREKAKEYLRFGLRSQGTGVLQKILFWFDIVLIDVYLGHEVQGLYKTAYTLMSYLSLATGTVAIMVFPTIAQALAVGDQERVRRTFSLGAFFSLTIALPFALAFVLFPAPILRLLMGEAFVPAAWMLRALGVMGLVGAVLTSFEIYFPAIGRPDLGLRLAAAEVAVTVVLNLILVPRIGVLGSVIATGAAFLTGLVVAILLMRKLGHELPRFDDVRRLLKGPLLPPPDEPPLV